MVSDPLCQRRIIKKSNKGERWGGRKANKSQHQAKDISKSFFGVIQTLKCRQNKGHDAFGRVLKNTENWA